jgi:hypothetical protein
VYAFFAYAWSVCETKNRTPKEVSRIPRTTCVVRKWSPNSFQGYAKNAYPWLSSWHRSAVLRSENMSPSIHVDHFTGDVIVFDEENNGVDDIPG